MDLQKNSIKLFLVSFVFSVFLGVTSPSYALEADQYRIWKQGLDAIDDSTVPTNTFLNSELQEFLQHKVRSRKAWQNPESCYEVAHKYMRYIRPTFFKDNLNYHW